MPCRSQNTRPQIIAELFEWVAKRIKKMLHVPLSQEFQVNIDSIELTIKIHLREDPSAINHEVWRNDELLFKINPDHAKGDPLQWILTPEYASAGIDKAFVQKVGEAIEKHYE